MLMCGREANKGKGKEGREGALRASLGCGGGGCCKLRAGEYLSNKQTLPG